MSESTSIRGYDATTPAKGASPTAATTNTTSSTELILDASQLHPHDVLMGRGIASSEYGGNKKLRAHVLEHRQAYQDTTRREAKHQIAQQIIASVTHQGGRFLRRAFLEKPASGGVTSAWTPVTDPDEILAKVKQLVRDVAPEAKQRKMQRRRKQAAWSKQQLQEQARGLSAVVSSSDALSSSLRGGETTTTTPSWQLNEASALGGTMRSSNDSPAIRIPPYHGHTPSSAVAGAVLSNSFLFRGGGATTTGPAREQQQFFRLQQAHGSSPTRQQGSTNYSMDAQRQLLLQQLQQQQHRNPLFATTSSTSTSATTSLSSLLAQAPFSLQSILLQEQQGRQHQQQATSSIVNDNTAFAALLQRHQLSLPGGGTTGNCNSASNNASGEIELLLRRLGREREAGTRSTSILSASTTDTDFSSLSRLHQLLTRDNPDNLALLALSRAQQQLQMQQQASSSTSSSAVLPANIQPLPRSISSSSRSHQLGGVTLEQLLQQQQGSAAVAGTSDNYLLADELARLILLERLRHCR